MYQIKPYSLWCRLITLLMVFNPFVIVSVQADVAVDKGLEIAVESKARDRGWADSSAKLQMHLYRKGGGEPALREMRILNLEMIGDGDKSLTIFDNPRDVQGTAFLSYTHIQKPDDQWLYLPALKRVKRISSKNKTSSFMGSEFSYEDLNSFEVDRYSYRWLNDELYNKQPCFVLEMIPLDKYSGYSKQIVWIDKQHYRALKVDYFNRKGVHEKTLVLGDYQQHLEQFWRAHTQTMVNHVKGRKTIINMGDYQFQTGLDDGDFTQNSLKRAR